MEAKLRTSKQNTLPNARSVSRPLLFALGSLLALWLGSFQGCALVELPLQSNSLSAVESLRVTQVPPNLQGSFERLYVVDGDLSKSEIVLPGAEISKLPRRAFISDRQTLTVVHVNDLHDWVTDHNPKGDIHRLAQVAKLVATERANRRADESVLFVSVGDEHIGTVYDELLGSTPSQFQHSAMYVGLSAMGLDVTTVGNHDLDKGARILSRAVRADARFPVITANIIDRQRPLPTHVAVIGVIGKLRVALIGLTTTIDTALKTSSDPGLVGINPLHTLEKLVPVLDPQVDVFLVLSHLGFNGPPPPGETARHSIKLGDVQVAKALGRLTDKPAAVIGGHTHDLLNAGQLDRNNVIDSVPIVQAGAFAEHVGKLTLALEANRNIIRSKATAKVTSLVIGRVNHPGHPDDKVPLETPGDYDPVFQTTVLGPMEDLIAQIMSKHLGTIVSAPELTDAVTVVSRYTGESVMANFMNDAVVAQSATFPGGKVDFAAFNATGVRGIDNSGDFTYGDWYQVMPYADEIVLYELTGSEIKAIIESNAQRIVQRAELIPAGTLDPCSFIPRGFLQFSSGITYEIVLGQTAVESRAQNIHLKGIPIEQQLDQTFRMAVPTFVANGRDHWDGTVIPGSTVPGFNFKAFFSKGKDTGLIYRNEIIAYILGPARGEVSAHTGAQLDGRVTALSPP